MKTTAYIACGSNLGDRERTIRDALLWLQQTGEILVRKVSPLYETEAEGFNKPAPPFINSVAELEVSCSATRLLEIMRETENHFGRTRSSCGEYLSRTLDLDLLLFGEEQIQQSNLVVPHPRMMQRWFVLRPLADLSPDLPIPGTKRTVVEVLNQIPIFGHKL